MTRRYFQLINFSDNYRKKVIQEKQEATDQGDACNPLCLSNRTDKLHLFDYSEKKTTWLRQLHG